MLLLFLFYTKERDVMRITPETERKPIDRENLVGIRDTAIRRDLPKRDGY